MKNTLRWLAMLLFCAFVPALVAAQDALPRVGWEESFRDISLWKNSIDHPESGTPPTAEALDGKIKITTCVGALDQNMKRPDWPEWPLNPGSEFSSFAVQYDVDVDLDLYHYLVVRIPEKSVIFSLWLNDKQTKVCYTTGIHSQDLKELGLSGKQKLCLKGSFLNTSGSVTLQYLRLVSELSEEEKKGLIGAGMAFREEKLTSVPYHGLEEFNKRAGRPARTGNEGSEWLVYRDTSTNAEIWKMTDLDANEFKVSFNCDGSAFSLYGRRAPGFDIFDWKTRAFIAVKGGCTDAAARFSTTEPESMIIAENTSLAKERNDKAARRIDIIRFNFRTGERSKIANFEPKTWVVQEFFSSPVSSKMLFGLRESPQVFLIDPSLPEGKRVREITLSTRLKGVGLFNNDTEIGWYNCYTYQGFFMNLLTGMIVPANRPSVGHAAGGPNSFIGTYGDMRIVVPNGLHAQTEETADNVKIFGNYKKPLETDYGHISANGKWMITDGMGGDLTGQHVMVPLNDPAAVMRICKHNTSRNDWDTNTYGYSSPDATKFAWVSDQFGNGDIYFAVTGRPASPSSLKCELSGGKAVLSWKAPEGMRELAGYRIYLSKESGRGFVPLNHEPLKGNSFTWTPGGNGADFFVVAAVEPSGIEGSFSDEISVQPEGATSAPLTSFKEAEETDWTRPARIVLNGEASGSRYLRIHHASSDEPENGEITFKPVLNPGKYALWISARAENSSGSWALSGGESSPEISGNRFAWYKFPKLVDIKGPGVISIALQSSTEGLALDKIAVSSDPSFTPGKEELTVSPAPVTELSSEAAPQSIKLSWKPSKAQNIARYDIHCGGSDDPKSLGNGTIIGSTADCFFTDWGLKPATEYDYKVVAVDSRGNSSAVSTLKVSTAAQPVQTISGEKLVDPADPQKITFTIDVKDEAPFMLWAKYRPAFVKDFTVAVEIDGNKAGNWKLRAPYRPMWWTLTAKEEGPALEFVDKISAGGKDFFTLAPGKHSVTLVLNPKLADKQHLIMELKASNDHSFRPAGYDPRADFPKGPTHYN